MLTVSVEEFDGVYSCLEHTSVLTPRAFAPLLIDSLDVAINRLISIRQTASVEILRR